MNWIWTWTKIKYTFGNWINDLLYPLLWTKSKKINRKKISKYTYGDFPFHQLFSCIQGLFRIDTTYKLQVISLQCVFRMSRYVSLSSHYFFPFFRFTRVPRLLSTSSFSFSWFKCILTLMNTLIMSTKPRKSSNRKQKKCNSINLRWYSQQHRHLNRFLFPKKGTKKKLLKLFWIHQLIQMKWESLLSILKSWKKQRETEWKYTKLTRTDTVAMIQKITIITKYDHANNIHSQTK